MQAATIFGGLGLFLYGMKIMSESLQSATGEGLKNVLWKATNNRFKGVLTGFGITSLIQSSSATTVMLVSFVSAGLINLNQSIGIIFGANIGTTVTGWIVAILGFKIKITSFALPAIAIGFFLRFLRKENVKHWGEVLLGFGILFLGLSIMSDAVKDLRGSHVVMNFMAKYTADNLFSTIMVVLVGTSVTMVVQSSSATMAMTMTLAFNGIIDFPTSCALILGENIGTTITANIASIGSSIEAKRAARVHLLFNLFGVVWVIAIFKPFFLPFINFIVPGDPLNTNINVRSAVIANHMAAFHTVFNVTNTLIFLPFTTLLSKIAEKMVLEKPKEGKGEFHLKYISTSLLSTPAMNINQARLEIRRMLGIVMTMFSLVIDVFKNPDQKLGDKVEEIQILEDHVDLLEKEISGFLVKVLQDTISEEQSQQITLMLHRINDLERIGDHCEVLLKLLRRKYEMHVQFTDDAVKNILEIAGKVEEFLSLINENLGRSTSSMFSTASVIENRINELRQEMRKDHISRLNDGVCDVNSGLIFIDMLTSFERMGDHAFNIAQGIAGVRVF
ncbi:MAG TPA: Na/Pi cotransporter family protein [Spirochaetota bacterium]|nr:Na/Pi cotransporter family protein [Spirochaetota bacterium]HPR49815.1 Na/Pi cotransporter family protein [Spirochaetota bacterium]